MPKDERSELVERLKREQAEVAEVAFHPDARIAARAAFDAAERVWKMVPEIIAALTLWPAVKMYAEAKANHVPHISQEKKK